MDNLRWMRMRWISLIIHIAALCIVVTFIVANPNMSKYTALTCGFIIGYLVTRFAVSWRYEMILNKFV